MESINILGVKVDRVNMDQSLEIIHSWIKEKESKKHYIVTPNVEFIMLAQKDEEFRKILCEADLSIPDSARFSWAEKVLREKSRLKKLLLIPFVLLPFPLTDPGKQSVGAGLVPARSLRATIKVAPTVFPTTPGVDLMEEICQKSVDWGITIGLLGGGVGVAEKTAECLIKKYPGIQISFAEAGGRVDRNGIEIRPLEVGSGKWESEVRSLEVGNLDQNQVRLGQNIKKSNHLTSTSHLSPLISKNPVDILFVAFGAGKQEKWIAKNLKYLPVKIAMGVGGSFDYISGNVLRAPLYMRNLGLEWLFRLIIQPWRIKRQLQLVRFVWKVIRV